VLSSQARVIAVDIPIDPPGLGVRPTDAGARAFVGGSRASSVFPTPPRAVLEARTFAEANEIARTITGKGISQQAFALGRKILEVHVLAEVDERVIEMHPEVSFRELAGEPLLESKHTAAGLARRRELLAAAGIVLPGAVPGVPEADLLDAAAGAWTAARYADRRAQAFPPDHTERLGAIWR
jgi:predicted RNase H-like nuclease